MRTYFEDLPVGETRTYGSYEVTREEILEFARQYDPQPFHVDEAAAEASVYGGLIASGWHTGSITMRLLVDGFVGDAASLGSPGLDELRWTAPVRPGDELSVRVEITEARELESRPDRGIATIESETLNQEDAVVMTMVSNVMFAKRDGADG